MSIQAKNQNGSLRGCLLYIALFFGVLYAVYYVCAKVLFAHSLPVYATSNNIKNMWPWTKNIEGLEYVTDGKEEKLWVLSLYDHKSSAWDKYYIDLINPSQKRLEESIELGYIPFAMSSSEMASWERAADNQLFISNKALPFQFRDGFTGKIKKTETEFISSFPQLKAGIGAITKTSNYEPNWFELTTKDGLKFLYQPGSNTMTTKAVLDKEIDEFRQWDKPIDVNDPKTKKCFAWGLGNDEVRKELYLVSEYKHIYDQRLYPNQLKDLYERRGKMDKELEDSRKQYVEARKHNEEINLKYKEARQRYNERKMRIEGKDYVPENLEEDRKRKEDEIRQRYASRTQREQQLLMHLKDKVFLNGSIIYGDSTLCVVLHATEISKSAQNKLTCIDKSGKIRWEIAPVPSDVLLVEPNLTGAYIRTHRQGENLVILNNYGYGQIGACKISLTDGKVVWDLDLM